MSKYLNKKFRESHYLIHPFGFKTHTSKVKKLISRFDLVILRYFCTDRMLGNRLPHGASYETMLMVPVLNSWRFHPKEIGIAYVGYCLHLVIIIISGRISKNWYDLVRLTFRTCNGNAWDRPHHLGCNILGNIGEEQTIILGFDFSCPPSPIDLDCSRY